MPARRHLQDFATLQAMLDEIQQNISLRQDTISLLTGEVSRLRTQMGGLDSPGLNTGAGVAAINGASASPLQLGAGSPADKAASMAASMLAARAEGAAASPAASGELLSGIFSPDRSTQANLGMYGMAVASIVFLGGVAVPVMEDKLGLGGEWVNEQFKWETGGWSGAEAKAVLGLDGLSVRAAHLQRAILHLRGTQLRRHTVCPSWLGQGRQDEEEVTPLSRPAALVPQLSAWDLPQPRACWVVLGQAS